MGLDPKAPHQRHSFAKSSVHTFSTGAGGESLRGSVMPDYGEILQFLAKNPPQQEAERKLHASMLELLAQCLRSEDQIAGQKAQSLHGSADPAREQDFAASHFNWVHFS
jgi:hypothetical protein